MRGVIFTELLDLIDKAFSPEISEQVLDGCRLESEGAYTSVGNYNHTEVLQIVTQLSNVTGAPPHDLIMAYGEFLFRRFAELYPTFFEGISDPLVFLKSVESHIHVEVLKLYSDSKLPTVKATDIGPGQIRIDYASHRPFADVAEALIVGCLKYFGAQYELTREDPPEESGAAAGCRAQFIVSVL